ncbi:MAG: hypothetical protein AAGJ18_22440, partial [Bacteroidota bacterium]
MRKVILMILCAVTWVDSIGQHLEELLSTYLSSFPSEKIYIGHDKPTYTVGETLWCKVYLLNGITHQPLVDQPIVYVDWIDPNGVISTTYYLKIEDGTAKLDIPIELTAKAGNYTLRAYTLYQKNFDPAYIFQKEIVVSDFFVNSSSPKVSATDYDVQFFPEGGNLVVGHTTKVAFKALNAKGESINPAGVVYETNGQQIATVKTIHEGMGFFNLKPKPATSYLVKTTYQNQEKVFSLPKPLRIGASVNFNTRAAEKISISLASNAPTLLQHYQLIGHLRGQIFYSQIFDRQSTVNLVMERDNLPTGLLTFTLFDAKKRPVSERLIFNKNTSEKVAVKVALPKTDFEKRSLVSGSIQTQLSDTLIASKLSFSVYNASMIPTELRGLTIENYLQLQSDLKGRIANIQQYFASDDTKTRTLLDLLLMTHGWRRFTWQQVLEQQKLDLTYPVETSFSFSGQITKELKKKPVKGNVFLNILDENNYAFANTTTGPEGLFYFDGFDFKDTTNLLIQANIYNEKKSKKLKEGRFQRVGNKAVDIHLFNLHELPFNPKFSIKPATQKAALAMEKYTNEVAKITGKELIDTSLWTIALSEVTVKGKQMTDRQKRYEDLHKRYREKGLIMFYSTDKFFTEDLYKYTRRFTDVFDLIRTAVPQAILAGPATNRRIYLSSRSAMANGNGIALDGELMSASRLHYVSPESIYAIEVITGLRAIALYGREQVIALLSKDEEAAAEANLKAQDIGMQQIVHPGFYQAKAFYSPNYANYSSSKLEDDLRITLYWSPQVKIEDAAHNFEFYTG